MFHVQSSIELLYAINHFSFFNCIIESKVRQEARFLSTHSDRQIDGRFSPNTALNFFTRSYDWPLFANVFLSLHKSCINICRYRQR